MEVYLTDSLTFIFHTINVQFDRVLVDSQRNGDDIGYLRNEHL